MSDDVREYSDMIKITAVGDGAVGKTSMLVSFDTHTFPEEYVPTVFDNIDTTHIVDNTRYNISLVDTAGQEDYDEIRQMSYEDVDVILCCFSVDNQTSLNNVQAKWVPEIRRHCDKHPILLVATKIDMEFKVNDKRVEHIRSATGCCAYVQCSAKTSKGLTEVFDTAIKAHLVFKKDGNVGFGFDQKTGGGGGGGSEGNCCSVM